MEGTHRKPCVTWRGTPALYQARAVDELEATYGFAVPHYSWITPSCGNELCLEADHLTANSPKQIQYPYGVCIYCGRPSWTKDHLFPRNWTGDALRKFVVTVPACSECNSVISDTITWSITERRAICHVRLRRLHQKVLRTKNVRPEELEEYGERLRVHIRAGMAKKAELLAAFNWPLDGAYDMRAMHKSGIENPWAIGLLLLPDDPNLEAFIKAAA